VHAAFDGLELQKQALKIYHAVDVGLAHAS